jgi:hypothetical protein
MQVHKVPELEVGAPMWMVQVEVLQVKVQVLAVVQPQVTKVEAHKDLELEVVLTKVEMPVLKVLELEAVVQIWMTLVEVLRDRELDQVADLQLWVEQLVQVLDLEVDKEAQHYQITWLLVVEIYVGVNVVAQLLNLN